MHTLYAVLRPLPMVLTKRICLTVKIFPLVDHFLFIHDFSIWALYYKDLKKIVTLRDWRVKEWSIQNDHITITCTNQKVRKSNVVDCFFFFRLGWSWLSVFSRDQATSPLCLLRLSFKFRNSELVSDLPLKILLYALSVTLYTAISRKVVGKVHATIPKGIMGGFEFTFLPKKIWKNGTKVFERMFTSSTKVGSTAAVLGTVH